MTVTNTTRKVREVGNAVKVTFSFDFPILVETDLVVNKINTAVDPEVLTLQVLNTDYTVSINAVTEGGTITYTSAPIATEDSFIVREVGKTQPADLPRESIFPEDTVETQLDRSRMIDLELIEEFTRTFKLPVNSTITDVVIPDPEDGKILQWSGTTGTMINVEHDTASLAAAVTAAELAETNAETAETNAETAETNAATSATNAATSETNAATSATAAAASAASIDQTKIVDADGDTSWESERTADVDTLHGKAGGTDIIDITATGMRLGASGARVDEVLDEDTMSSDSAVKISTQQSIKAYVDTEVAGAPNLSNVIFAWSGVDGAVTEVHGMVTGWLESNQDITPDISGATYDGHDEILAVKSASQTTVLRFQFVKIAGVSTVTINARLWADTTNAAQEAIMNVDIGGQSNTVKSVASATPSWVTTSNIDVSGLSNGTTYDGIVQLANENGGNLAYCSAVTLTGS